MIHLLIYKRETKEKELLAGQGWVEGGRRGSCRVRQGDDKKSIVSAVGLLKEIKIIFLLGVKIGPLHVAGSPGLPSGNGLWPPHIDRQMVPAPQATERSGLVCSLWVPSSFLSSSPQTWHSVSPDAVAVPKRHETWASGNNLFQWGTFSHARQRAGNKL